MGTTKNMIKGVEGPDLAESLGSSGHYCKVHHCYSSVVDSCPRCKEEASTELAEWASEACTILVGLRESLFDSASGKVIVSTGIFEGLIPFLDRYPGG